MDEMLLPPAAPPLAVGARPCDRDSTCELCGEVIARGVRMAQLHGRWCHVSCIAKAG
jgi:hypothetical protein